MSSEVESPELEESPAKAEKAAGGRRNPRRSTRNANPIKSEDSPESRKPSRKGSETRVTRSKSNRSRKKSGSPTFRSSKGSLGTDSQESPAARVKSSRRASSRVNYKESEGEEDPLPELPKEEEEFKSEDDWDDSEGGEGKKKKEASSKRSPAKSRRTVAKEGKSRSRTSRSKRSDRSKRGKKDETEEEDDDEESNKEDEKSDEKEASVDSDKKDLPTDEEEAKKTSDAGNAVNEEVKEVINKEPTENQVEEVPPSDNKDPADADPEKKEEKQDPSSQESAKRKLEEVEENDESEEARKKPKLETEVVKSNESSYHRSSPVIVENKQFSEASKETPMEVDTNDGDSTAAVTTNETSTNDSTEHSHPLEPSINGSSLLTKHTQSIPGLYIANPSLPPEKIDHLRPYTFTLVSYNLQGPDSTLKENNCANEIKSRMADIVCLQSITSSFFTEKIQSISKELGYHDVMTDGLALLYKPSVFEIVSNSPISLHSLIERDLEGKPAEVVEAAMKYLKDLCCKAYVVELRSLLEGSHLLRLCNVALPALLDPSCTTLLMCRLLKEINSSPDLPHILCGEFNPVNWVSQVLVTGYISDELDQEMRRRKDIFLSNQEAISLVEVLPNLHSNTSLQYTNCYTTVMGSQKSSGGSEQVWASANSLGTLGVWEPALALQARLAFSE